MTAPVPCRDPENDPQDWFIASDGKQYRWEEFITDDEILTLLPEEHTPEEFAAAKRRLSTEIHRAQLRRRRHAREKCFECPIRTACLAAAIERREPHGTWGGYFEENLDQLYKAIDKRVAARAGVL